VTVELDLRKLS